jgi:hypothetical protein
MFITKCFLLDRSGRLPIALIPQQQIAAFGTQIVDKFWKQTVLDSPCRHFHSLERAKIPRDFWSL